MRNNALAKRSVSAKLSLVATGPADADPPLHTGGNAVATLKAKLLYQLLDFLPQVELSRDEDFSGVMAVSRDLLGLQTAADFAALLGVSTPTVQRWFQGKNLPYLAARRGHMGELGNAINARIAALESEGATIADLP